MRDECEHEALDSGGVRELASEGIKILLQLGPDIVTVSRHGKIVTIRDCHNIKLCLLLNVI